jgi:ribosomal protein S18 acetylase RimI-like enzyme
MDFLIRDAVPDDAEAISHVRVEGWRESYAHILSARFLAALDASAQVERWRDFIASGRNIVVAEVHGDVRGFAISGPARTENSPHDLELQAIYQLASMHGSGSGQALLDASIGNQPAYLWVAELNPRAIALYRRNGFRADGERMISPESENVAEVRMVR